MVTIIWLILSFVGVCSFSWWPVLVESLVLLILTAVVTLGHPGEWASFFMVTMGGFAVFAALKLFCGLSLSPLWLAAAPVWNLAALVIPGGYTIGAIVLSKMGMMSLPTWIFMVALLIDSFSLNQILKHIFEKRR